ncbi:MAG: glycosyltransferase family 9 protein [Bacteroidales bacterium]
MAKNREYENNSSEGGSSKYKNILVIRFTALGDVAISIPMLYSFCYSNPDTEFTMLTQRFASTLFVNPPANLKVIGIDTSNQYKGIKGMYRLYKDLSATNKFDAVADLHDVLRSHILSLLFSLLSGAKVRRINKGRRGKRRLTRGWSKRMFQLRSSHERYREVFHRFGLRYVEIFETVFGGEKAEAKEFEQITAPKSSDERWIAIAPFAKHQGKIYPLDKMKEVVDGIATMSGVKIFLFGAGDYERGVLSEWVDVCENVISMAEKKSSIAVELALLSHIDVMVSMDSANMHLSSLVGLPVVSVWGATHPYCGFMGWRQSERNAVQLSLPCRPCSVFGNKPCRNGDYACLNNITPEMIISKIEDLLNR